MTHRPYDPDSPAEVRARAMAEAARKRREEEATERARAETRLAARTKDPESCFACVANAVGRPLAEALRDAPPRVFRALAAADATLALAAGQAPGLVERETEGIVLAPEDFDAGDAILRALLRWKEPTEGEADRKA